MTTIDRIRKYVRDAVLARGGSFTLPDEGDLLQALDSLQLLRMILELEKAFGVRIENGDLTPENLGSIASLAAFVARRQSAPEGVAAA